MGQRLKLAWRQLRRLTRWSSGGSFGSDTTHSGSIPHMRQSVPWWLVLASMAGAVTFAALVLALRELLCGKQVGAASWVMAAGGMGIFIFSTVQLHRDGSRERDRLAGARAKLKPAAWLARRMCEQAVIESDGKSVHLWMARWETRLSSPLNDLEARMRETVTLSAEAMLWRPMPRSARSSRRQTLSTT